MSIGRTTLARPEFVNALGKFAPQLTPAMRELTEKLLSVMESDGRVSVAAARDALFPLAKPNSASAQLSKLLAAVQTAAEKSGCDVAAAYQGTKSGGVAGRTLEFQSASVTITIEADLSATQKEPAAVEPRGMPMRATDIVLMTFNQHEHDAVTRTFWGGNTPPPRVKDVALPVVDLGEHGGIQVLHYHGEQGSRHSARDATELCYELCPRFILPVGIAFGIDAGKQRIGDVLVSKFLVDYDAAMVQPSGEVALRGAQRSASRKLFDELMFLNRRMTSSSTTNTSWPAMHFGGLLTGDKLIDNLALRESLIRMTAHDDIVGGEMEGAGLSVALEGKDTQWVIVKAICDFADGQKGKDKDSNQLRAAHNAAMVVKALLDEGGQALLERRHGTHRSVERASSGTRVTSAKAQEPQAASIAADDGPFRFDFEDELTASGEASPFNNASLASLSTATREPKQAQPEPKGIEVIADILNWLGHEQSPPLYAVLGEYGMGKTFTCQRATYLINQRRKQGESLPQALYLDLRKVAGAQAPSEREHRRGHVPSLQEVMTDCLRHGVLTGSGRTPTVDDVWAAIDAGAVVFFDGLDEVLNLLNDHQGQIFTANLLRLHTEARRRAEFQQGASRAGHVRLVVSCRTQFFRSLLEQNQQLTGEWRGTHDDQAFRAVVMLPFDDKQIRNYLRAAFPNRHTDALISTIESVHNLREMAGRPFTLKLITRFLPRIEQWRAQGRKVSGVTLYREVAQDWLMRDKNKQHFRIEDKLALATDLAVHLWREGERGIAASDLETWLGGWLKRQSPDAEFQGKARELLQEDLRNATFLKRVDGKEAQDSRFHFAHTSLQEFLLANHLFHALDVDAEDTSALRRAWALPMVSVETLEFLGQMLEEAGDTADRLRRLCRMREPYERLSSELLMRYGQLAYERDLPAPSLIGIDLSGASLEGWHFGSRTEPPYATAPGKSRLDLSRARFDGARLIRSRFWYVRLDGASFGMSLSAQAEWLDCTTVMAVWNQAELSGAVFRPQPSTQTIPPNVHPALMIGRGHAGRVIRCAFSPDGTRVISTSTDRSQRIWDAASAECLGVTQVHEGWAQPGALSPDGTRIVTTYERSLLLWDAASGERLRLMQGHEDLIRGYAYSLDGARIVSGSQDGSLRLWNSTTGECLRVMRGHGHFVMSCAFSPDGTRIVSTSDDGSLRLWGTVSGECLRVMQLRDRYPQACAAFSPDGVHIVSGGHGGQLRLWDAASGECLRVMQGNENRWVDACIFSPDGARIVSTSGDGSLLLWDVNSGECVHVMQGNTDSVACFALSPDGTRIVSASDYGSLQLWDTSSGECLRVMQGDQGRNKAFAAFSPDGTRIVSALGDRSLGLWDAASGECVGVMRGHEGPLWSCAFSPDGRHIVSGAADFSLRLWNAAGGECLRAVKGNDCFVFCCAFSPDGTRIVYPSSGGLRIWDLTSGQCLRVMHGHKGSQLVCAFSPDGARIVSASDDGALRLWDTSSGECLRVMRQELPYLVWGCAFSPDGARIASASGDGLRIWDADSGECLRVMQAHIGGGQGCAFSPDGARIVSAFGHGLRIWDAATGECLRVIQGHEERVRSCAFSPNGARIVSASNDRSLRIWDAASGECLRVILCAERATATLDLMTNRVEHAEGSAWRHWAWHGIDDAGQPKAWPLDAMPGVEINPWHWA